MHSQAKKKHVMHVGPNMTPMVDIVMCILIFFMLTMSFAVQELYLTNNTPAVDKKGLGTEKADSRLPAVKYSLELRRIGGSTKVVAFGKMFEGIDDLHPADRSSSRLDEITAFLKAKRQDLSDDVQIILTPERNVPWQDVTTLYDLCMRAQFKTVAFAPPR